MLEKEREHINVVMKSSFFFIYFLVSEADDGLGSVGTSMVRMLLSVRFLAVSIV